MDFERLNELIWEDEDENTTDAFGKTLGAFLCIGLCIYVPMEVCANCPGDKNGPSLTKHMC